MPYKLSGYHAGTPFSAVLEAGSYRVGRGSQNEIHLRDSSVSRSHAEITIEGGRIILRDLGSSNGTYLNDSQMLADHELTAGDRIRFGNLELTLVAPGGQPPPAVASHTILADPDEISAMERMSWEEASGQSQPDAAAPHELFRAVTEVGQLLMTTHALDEVLERVLDLVERVIPARRILLLLSDSPDGPPVVRAARPQSAGSERLALSSTIQAAVMRERNAMRLLDMQSDPRFSNQESIVQQNLRSAMVAPLFDNTQVIGLLYTDSDDPRVRFDRNQLRALTLLANLIAVKITNTRLEDTRREKERMQQELDVATQVQQRLLPATLPEIPGYQVQAHQKPCFEVGGDLYEVARLDDGRVAIVLGDVTGKGMGAALLMSNVLAGLRILHQECLAPDVLVDRLHREMLASTDVLHYVTLFLGMLDPRSHRLDYVNAGHNPPILIDSQGEMRNLAATGMPIGLLPQADYTVGSVEMAPGSLLCIYSDAFPEAAVEDEFYGDERFFASIGQRRTRPLDDIVAGVLSDLDAFLGDTPPGDDATLLLLRCAEPTA